MAWITQARQQFRECDDEFRRDYREGRNRQTPQESPQVDEESTDVDENTLRMRRQRRFDWQVYMRDLAQGLCGLCGEPVWEQGESACLKHTPREYRPKAIRLKAGSSQELIDRHRAAQAAYMDRKRQAREQGKYVFREKYGSAWNDAGELRKVVIENYGGRCACCGETELEFLQLDHVDNDGFVARKYEGTGLPFYRQLIVSEFPETIQVLCANCHLSKHRGGRCIHAR